MAVRMSGTLVLAAGLLLPASGTSVQGQTRGSTRTVDDVERAVRIGAMVYGATREIRKETAAARRERERNRGGGAGGSSGSRTGGSSRVPAPPPRGSARMGARVVSNGEQYLGVRYKWGGNTPSEGFDCSGFVKYVFARNGVELPRTSRQQAQVGASLPARVSALRQGDLLFFASDGRRIDHVAIYAGSNRIIHSSSSGGGVLYDDLDSSRGRWFVKHMVAARRVADDGGSLVDALFAAQFVIDYFDPPDRAPPPRR